MAVGSRTELVEKLALGDFAALYGTAESVWLDFKSQPYDNESGRLTNRGRWNLAHDVACLANKNGGLLVLGFTTERPEGRIVEQASSHSLIPRLYVDAEAYAKVIADWIYPRVRDVAMHWFPRDGTVGIFVIEVPPQDTRDQPFFVRRSVDDADRASSSWSVPIRDGDRCEPMPIERLHAEIGLGRSVGVGGPVQSWQPDEDQEGRRNGRLEEARNLLSEETPADYSLQWFPPSGAPTMPDFYAVDGVREQVRNPPAIRNMGFNLTGHGTVEVIEGCLVHYWSQSVLWVDPDGATTTVAAASPDFLAWGTNRTVPPRPGLILNPLAVVEFTYEACRFAYEMMRVSNTSRDRWSGRIVARNMKAADVRLQRGARRELFNPDGAPASSNAWVRSVAVASTPETAAFRVLSAFYALFGLGDDAIPYCEGEAVSREQILAVR